MNRQAMFLVSLALTMLTTVQLTVYVAHAGNGRHGAAFIGVAPYTTYAGMGGQHIAPSRLQKGSGPLIAFTRHNNVYLANANGSGLVTVTTRGTGTFVGISYPSYSWSPDGKYLLLVREATTTTGASTYDLLLLDRNGNVLRTLVSHLSAVSPAFNPAWAVDSDQIAYIASSTSQPNAAEPALPHLSYVVKRIDLSGHSSVLWTYSSRAPQDCGAGGDMSVQLSWKEIGYQGVVSSLTWSLARHVAIYNWGACAGMLAATDLNTGRSRVFSSPGAAAHTVVPMPATTGNASLSPSGELAYEITRYGAPNQTTHEIVVSQPSATAPYRVITSGELPTWSPDGRTLYFVRTTAGQSLPMRDANGYDASSTAATTSVWSAQATGLHIHAIVAEEGYGLGQLHVTADGRALIFVHIDDELNLWQHRLPGGVVNDALLKLYGPRTEVQRLDIAGGRLTTILPDAGNSAVQP